MRITNNETKFCKASAGHISDVVIKGNFRVESNAQITKRGRIISLLRL